MKKPLAPDLELAEHYLADDFATHREKALSLRHGITEYSCLIAEPKDAAPQTVEFEQIGEFWPHWGYNLLDREDAFSTCLMVLIDGVWDGPGALTDEQMEKVRTPLRPFHRNAFDRCLKHHTDKPGTDLVCNIIYTAAWVDLFEEKFSTRWYAAHALYAPVGKRGAGKSPEANRKIWVRRRKKLRNSPPLSQVR